MNRRLLWEYPRARREEIGRSPARVSGLPSMEPPTPLNRIEIADEIFSEALELPLDQRTVFVRGRCSSDGALCESVLNLLSGFNRLGDFLQTPAVGSEPAAAAFSPGEILGGRFRIVSLIGRGGMGEVYRDRKSTRLNSSHLVISYAVFCLKKKNMRRTPGGRADVYRRLPGRAQPNTHRVLYKDPALLIYLRLNSADRSIHHLFFFFNDTATTEIYTLSLHDALPIWISRSSSTRHGRWSCMKRELGPCRRSEEHTSELQSPCNLVCRLLLEKKKN